MQGWSPTPAGGKVAITAEGLNVLAQKPEQINCRFLKQYPTYLSFIGQNPDDSAGNPATPAAIIESIVTPQEQIDASFQALRKATGEELLERLRKCSPGFFEIVVVRLLQALGYGATGEALVTGKSGDGGVDGIIKEDKLGLDVVCVQAKRWEDTVGRPVVQAFVGSMDFVRARKGVVITTSNFSREAFDYVERIGDKKVVLIDGNRLTGLMIDYGVGVTVSKRYELKDVSSDFFGEDME
jgi:restriction system protein